ncbi:hypothetical protein ABB02_01269 [Clostridiaceae bacterium JG1575]|nr:hypothetical protein ABB02_01269 [Clostridiaceae bacterium JG1575]
MKKLIPVKEGRSLGRTQHLLRPQKEHGEEGYLEEQQAQTPCCRRVGIPILIKEEAPRS